MPRRVTAPTPCLWRADRASSIDFLCMRPIFGPGGQVTLLLHSDRNCWRVSLDSSTTSPSMQQRNSGDWHISPPASAAASTSSPPASAIAGSNPDDEFVIDAELREFMAASQVQRAVAYMDEHETHGSASVDDRGTDDVPGQTMGFSYADLEAPEDHASAVAVVQPIFALARHLRGYSRRLYDLVNTTPKLGDPYVYPSKAPEPLGSRASHQSNTAKKDMPKNEPSRRSGRSQSMSLDVDRSSSSGRGGRGGSHGAVDVVDTLLDDWQLSKMQQFWTHHGVTVVFGRGRSGTIVCVKHKPRGHAKEIAMTRLVQGHPNIACFIAAKDLTGRAAGIVLVEELLFHDHTLMRSASQAAGLPRLVTYILHGLAALEHLAARRIAHCDISKNNFMFSRDRQMWCLTDFGGAAQIPAGCTSIHRERLYGTDPFIAPEALSDHVYSIASDLWSFGMVAFNVAEDVFSSPAGRTLAQINAECRVGSEIRAEIRRLTRNQPSLRAAASDVRQAFVKLQRRVDELANRALLLRSSRWTRPMRLPFPPCSRSGQGVAWRGIVWHCTE
ncbi:kinase-like domain-containing protein [Entophlyctis helioformis]|nr:kinase-like domain-containing protein [Entophlyctis helioformis]